MNELIVNYCNGNPGALSVFKLVIETFPQELENLILKLEQYNIKGSDIWIIYKECNKDISEFLSYNFENYRI